MIATRFRARTNYLEYARHLPRAPSPAQGVTPRDVTSKDHIGRRYPPLIATTDSCARPKSSLSLGLPLYQESSQVVANPCWKLLLVDVVSTNLSLCVWTDFQEVEDNLAALRILEEETAFQDLAVRAAQQVVAITTNQYQAGTVAYINVLVAQSTALANERTVLGLLGRRMTATVLLVKALGGGWVPKEPK